MNIAFWKKESGNFMNHSQGLSVEQIEFLKSLKPGDRLIIYVNVPKEGQEHLPTHSLKKYESRKEGGR